MCYPSTPVGRTIEKQKQSFTKKDLFANVHYNQIIQRIQVFLKLCNIIYAPSVTPDNLSTTDELP
jgi:hypothetical protein